MAEATRGMGRGLEAILSTNIPQSSNSRGNGASTGDGRFREIALNNIVANPDQPRRIFDESALVALADSIRERGLIQPVLVRSIGDENYQLVAGERRWRAATLAGLSSIPAMLCEHNDKESLEVGLIENMVRQDLTPVEEARACSVLVSEFGMTREDVGRRVGRSRVAVSNLLRLLDLPDDVLELLNSRDLTEGHGRALLLASDHQHRRQLARSAVAQGWTVRQTESRAKAVATGSVDSPSTNDNAKSTKLEAAGIGSDQLEAADRLSERLSASLGCEVSVIPDGAGFRATMVLESLAAGLAVADNLEN